MSPEELVEYGIAIASQPFGDRSANIEGSIAIFTTALEQIPEGNRYLRGYAEYQRAMSLQERLVGPSPANLAAARQGYLRCVQALEGLDDITARDLLGQALGNLANLAAAFGDFEAGIAYAERSLEYLIKWINPRGWGVSQQNLGACLSNRTRGDKAENLRRAIDAFEAALEVRPPNGPEPALYQRTEMARQQARAELEALAAGDRPPAQPEAPEELVRGEQLLREHRRTGDATLLAAAIEAYTAALGVLDEEADAELWATATNNLASCYAMRRSEDEDVERAIAGYTAALRVRTRTRDPLRWATTQSSLALAYLNRKSGDPLANARAAVAAGESALLLLNQTTTPDEWYGAVHNLGTAYVVLFERSGDSGGLAELSQGINLLETSATKPSSNVLQNRQLYFHLARAYQALAEQPDVDRMARIEARSRAVTHFEVLRGLSDEDTAEMRAASGTLLALAQSQESERDPFHATEAFIAETEASLDSLAETSNRRGFLLVNRRLGDAYMRRLVGDRTDNARSAITAYQRAMELAEPQSVELAGVHRNLGDAYRVVADSEAASHSYRAALAAYADADRHEARDVADVFAQLYVIEARRIRRSLPQLAGPRSAGGAP